MQEKQGIYQSISTVDATQLEAHHWGTTRDQVYNRRRRLGDRPPEDPYGGSVSG